MGFASETPEQQRARQAESERVRNNADKNFMTGTLQEMSTAGDAESGKRNYVAGVMQSQKETLDYGRTAAQGGALVSPSQKVDLLNSLDATRRQQLSGAAADGVMHSGALGQARRAAAQKQAMASAALIAEEERLQREQTAKIQQMSGAVSQAATEGMPTFVEKDGHQYPVFEKDWATYRKRDDEITSILGTLQKNRLPPEKLQSMFNEEIQRTYSQLAGEAISEARRLGMSDQYVAGLEQSMKQDMNRALSGSSQMVAALSGPDPQAVATYLQGIYRPDMYQAAEQLRAGNPMLSILAGGIGAMIGGASTMTPQGAAAGYGIGSGVGQFIGTLG
jgi:hypothetical protein